jgi:hypothetical protein
MDTQPPWFTYPSLTDERLGIIGRLLADVRHEAVILHESSKGDSNWSLGCRIYSRSCYAIVKASEQYDWLTVVEDTGLHFVFGIGVPLRFYKGEPEKTPARSLRRNFPEIHAHQLALFGQQPERADDILRIAVESDEHGEAERMTLVQLVAMDEDEGDEHLRDSDGREILNRWPINFKAVPSVAPIEKRRDGVVQQPAKVLPFKTETKEEDENA